jgi:hypothetical protein
MGSKHHKDLGAESETDEALDIPPPYGLQSTGELLESSAVINGIQS